MEKAYAKINLFLNVLGKREDQYHELEMVMAPLAMHDVLSFKKRKDNEIRLTTSAQVTDDVEDNLVFQVAKYLQDNYGLAGIDIHLEKNIPIAAGLGGGSADCAATLRGLNRLFNLDLSLEQLAAIGEGFGADVPYCVYNKPCIARGKGEELFFLKRKFKRPVLLVVPDIRIRTRDVYQRLTMDEVTHIKITKMTNAIYNRNYPLMVKELHNALTPFAKDIAEEVRILDEKLADLDVDGYVMSGSGPSFFVFDKDLKRLHDLAKVFGDEYYTKVTKIL